MDNIGVMTIRQNIYDDNDKNISSVVYNAAGDIIYTLSYEYDANGNCISLVDSRHFYDTQSEYDDKGRKIKEINKFWGVTTLYTYDDKDRLLSMDFNGIIEYYEYDSNNNISCVIKSDGSRYYMNNKYDSNNRLISFENPYSFSTTLVRIEYADNGNKIKETHIDTMCSHVYEYIYDDRNRCICVTAYKNHFGQLNMDLL